MVSDPSGNPPQPPVTTFIVGGRGTAGGKPVRSSVPHGPGSRGGKPRKTATTPGAGSGHTGGSRVGSSSGGTARPTHTTRSTTSHPKKTQAPDHQTHHTSTSTKSGATHHQTPAEHLRQQVELNTFTYYRGFSFGHKGALHGQSLGHHPQATGKLDAYSTRHNGLPRRATIVSYDPGTNTAVVSYGDDPDSASVSIPVSPAITAAEIGAATMAGVQLWDDTDPTDALITTVL